MKALKPRAMRRLLLFMALIFPVVYLCGGLFFALNGAHGNQLFAEPVYEEQWVVVPNTTYIDDDSEYRYTLDADDYESWVSHMLALGNVSLSLDFNIGGDSFYGFRIYPGATSYLNLFTSSVSTENQTTLCSYDGTSFLPRRALPWVFSSFGNDFSPYIISVGVLEVVKSIPISVVPENNSAFTDFVFSHPFATNNFISELGKGVINNDNAGFAPMNTLFYTINENVLHFSEDDALAVFGFGYVYYAVNVLVIYEVVVLAVKLIMLPLKAVDAIGVNREGD